MSRFVFMTLLGLAITLICIFHDMPALIPIPFLFESLWSILLLCLAICIGWSIVLWVRLLKMKKQFIGTRIGLEDGRVGNVQLGCFLLLSTMVYPMYISILFLNHIQTIGHAVYTDAYLTDTLLIGCFLVSFSSLFLLYNIAVPLTALRKRIYYGLVYGGLIAGIIGMWRTLFWIIPQDNFVSGFMRSAYHIDNVQGRINVPLACAGIGISTTMVFVCLEKWIAFLRNKKENKWGRYSPYGVLIMGIGIAAGLSVSLRVTEHLAWLWISMGCIYGLISLWMAVMWVRVMMASRFFRESCRILY